MLARELIPLLQAHPDAIVLTDKPTAYSVAKVRFDDPATVMKYDTTRVVKDARNGAIVLD